MNEEATVDVKMETVAGESGVEAGEIIGIRFRGDDTWYRVDSVVEDGNLLHLHTDGIELERGFKLARTAP